MRKGAFAKAAMTACVGILGICVNPASASTVFTLSIDAGAISGGPYGTITLTNITGGVHVSVAPYPGFGFLNTGAGEPLLFNLSGSPSVTVTSLTAGFTFVDFTPGLSSNQDGTGMWEYAISCSSPTCGPGGSNPYLGSFSFDIKGTGVTETSFISTSDSNNYVFASDICIWDGTVCTATGDAAASSSSSTSSGVITTSSGGVPEPNSSALALIGVALLAGTMVMRKRSSRA